MLNFSDSAEWLFRTPANATYREQADHIRRGIALAESAGSPFDVISLRISLAKIMCLDGHNSDAAEVLQETAIPAELARSELPRYLAQAYVHAGETSKALDAVRYGFDPIPSEPLCPAEHEEYKRRRCEAIRIAARVGVGELRAQFKAVLQDVKAGYSFHSGVYPFLAADLMAATEDLWARDWLRATFLPNPSPQKTRQSGPDTQGDSLAD